MRKFTKNEVLKMAERTASFSFRNDENEALKPILNLIEAVFIPEEMEFYSQLHLAESIMRYFYAWGFIKED